MSQNTKLVQATTGPGAGHMQISARKPKKEEFFRINPNPEYQALKPLVFYAGSTNGQPKAHLLSPWLEEEYEHLTTNARLFTCMNRHGVTFLWPARLATAWWGTYRSWAESALECAEIAQKTWIRLTTNMTTNRYEALEAKEDLGQPVWPQQPFTELVDAAFCGPRFIDRLDHPVLAGLEGTA